MANRANSTAARGAFAWQRRTVLGALIAGAYVRAPVAAAEWLRDEIVVYADPALRAMLCRLAARYPAALRVFCAPPDQLIGLLAHDTQDDVLILPSAAMARAQAAGVAKPGGARLWRNHLVLAGKSGGLAVAPFDQTALLAALGRGTLAIPDPTPASTVDGQAVLDHLGLTAAVAGRVQGVASTGDALDMVQAGSATLALCHISEIVAGHDIHAVMAVPQSAYDPIEYTAALCSRAWSRNQDALLDALPHAPEAMVFGLEAL